MFTVVRRRIIFNNVRLGQRQQQSKSFKTSCCKSRQPFLSSLNYVESHNTIHNYSPRNQLYRTLSTTTSNNGLWTRIQDIVKTFLGIQNNGNESPRELQERKDLSMSLLALTHNRLRNELQSNDTHVTKKHQEELIDQAIHILEQHGLERQSVVGLRYELQCVIAPQICNLFETFQYVDDQFSTSPEKLHKGLMADYQETHAQLLKLSSEEKEPTKRNNNKTNSRPDPKLFLTQKLNALERLVSYHGWDSSGVERISMDDGHNNNIDDDSGLDEFGYNPRRDNGESSSDAERAIRHYQTINMVRSKFIQDQMGYSVVSLRSTIPSAGRGVFVDGYAKAGSLIAFYPGDVWPKEYLSGATSSAMSSYFQHDPNYQLSLRYDDIAIDSRRSPYTVLYHGDGDDNDDDEDDNMNTNDIHNPWALAHIVNHPPLSPHNDNVITPPNCRTVMLNFTEPMKLESSGLFHYVPNTYAKPPMILGPKALDRDVIVMHGMGLITARDVSNEELFVDYRLSGGDGADESSDGSSNTSFPDWYHVVEPNEVASRWWKKS